MVLEGCHLCLKKGNDLVWGIHLQTELQEG